MRKQKRRPGLSASRFRPLCESIFLNTDEVTAPAVPPPAKVALHDVEMPEMTIGGKVKPSPKANRKGKVQAASDHGKHDREKMDVRSISWLREDAIKYMPSIQVRSRYIGDTNAPVGDAHLGHFRQRAQPDLCGWYFLSSLLGNNNTNTGSPRWNTVSPGEIERIDIMYGPFSAAYAGNSIGGVINITTRMPEKFELGRMRKRPGRLSISMAQKKPTIPSGIRIYRSSL